MPELIEVEMYAEALRPLIGRRVTAIDLPDPDFLRPKGTGAASLDVLRGRPLADVRRIGKLLLADFGARSSPDTLGLRFGMTGRLIVDGRGPIDQLVYSSRRDGERWDRFVLGLGRARVAIRDPRRLGNVELEPDEERLGPDAASIGVADLTRALAGRTAPLKAILLDQSAVAGLGNLLIDEALWAGGFDPRRPAGELDAEDRRRLARTIRTTVSRLSRRGGSHTGDSFELRAEGAACSRDGVDMRRDRVGGRTTWWCPAHQR